MKKRIQHKTEDELINDTYDDRQRLVQKMSSFDAQSGKPSARISGRSKASQRRLEASNTEEENQIMSQNPYQNGINQQQTISGYLNANKEQIGSSR